MAECDVHRELQVDDPLGMLNDVSPPPLPIHPPSSEYLTESRLHPVKALHSYSHDLDVVCLIPLRVGVAMEGWG